MSILIAGNAGTQKTSHPSNCKGYCSGHHCPAKIQRIRRETAELRRQPREVQE